MAFFMRERKYANLYTADIGTNHLLFSSVVITCYTKLPCYCTSHQNCSIIWGQHRHCVGTLYLYCYLANSDLLVIACQMWNTLLEVFWCLNWLYSFFNLSVLTNGVSDVPRNSEARARSLYPGHSSLSACIHKCACTSASARCGPYLMQPSIMLSMTFILILRGCTYWCYSKA